MRIYITPLEAVAEVQRDLYEMGIDVHPQTMQDKAVGEDEDYLTKEIRGYGFKIVDWWWNQHDEVKVFQFFCPEDNNLESTTMVDYTGQEFLDRLSENHRNPGSSYKYRPHIWSEFLHNGKFAYTYNERMKPQIVRTFEELRTRPETRQAIINLHTNICPTFKDGLNIVTPSMDFFNTGGSGRIPCSMYYQFMIRENKLDLIYTMRSCDFLTHFPVDLMLALRLQTFFANNLAEVEVGTFTYFTGSLHAYMKDLKPRGIF